MIENNRALYADTFMPATRILSESCIGAIGVDGAAIAILTDDAQARDLLYATDATAARLDELQFTTGEGPCLDAFRAGHPRILAELGEAAVTEQWPIFVSEVIGELGVHAIFAFPIFFQHASFGILEMYRRQPAPLTTLQHNTAMAIASVIGPTIGGELSTYGGTPDGLTHGVVSGNQRPGRVDVHIATGMLSVRLKTTVADAGAQLRARAYAESRSVSSMAYDIVHNNAVFGVE